MRLMPSTFWQKSTRSQMSPQTPRHNFTSWPQFSLLYKGVTSEVARNCREWSMALKHDSIQKILPGIKIGLPLSKDYITQGNICMFHLFSHWFKSTEFKGLSDNLLTGNKGPVFFLLLPPCSSPKSDEWYNPYGWLYSWDINLICYYYADP